MTQTLVKKISRLGQATEPDFTELERDSRFGNGGLAGGGGMMPSGAKGDDDESRYVASSSLSPEFPFDLDGGLMRSTFHS
jgi:hypothetical protein